MMKLYFIILVYHSLKCIANVMVKIRIPNVNYQQDSNINQAYSDRELFFNQTSTRHIDGKPFDEDTKEIIIMAELSSSNQIKCVFADGLINEINITLHIDYILNENLNLTMANNHLRIHGSFVRKYSMFCLINNIHNIQQSFNTYFNKQLDLIANNMYFSTKRSFSKIYCDGIISSQILNCTNSIQMIVFMEIGQTELTMETITFKIYDDHLFFDIPYRNITQQLINNIRYFSKFDEIIFQYITGDIINKRAIFLNDLSSTVQKLIFPIRMVNGDFIMDHSSSFAYIYNFYFTAFFVKLYFYRNDFCGKQRLYLCHVDHCLSSISECIFFDPESSTTSETLHSTLSTVTNIATIPTSSDTTSSITASSITTSSITTSSITTTPFYTTSSITSTPFYTTSFETTTPCINHVSTKTTKIMKKRLSTTKVMAIIGSMTFIILGVIFVLVRLRKRRLGSSSSISPLTYDSAYDKVTINSK